MFSLSLLVLGDNDCQELWAILTSRLRQKQKQAVAGSFQYYTALVTSSPYVIRYTYLSLAALPVPVLDVNLNLSVRPSAVCLSSSSVSEPLSSCQPVSLSLVLSLCVRPMF